MTIYARDWPARLIDAAGAVRAAAGALRDVGDGLAVHFGSTAGVFEGPVADDMRRAVEVRRSRLGAHAGAVDAVAAMVAAAGDEVAAKIARIDAGRADRVAAGTPPGTWPELDDRWL